MTVTGEPQAIVDMFCYTIGLLRSKFEFDAFSDSRS